ncbi:hypothetical protein H8356DRAFT_1416775 [Neocallimastix lanati (nom. inval.)]|nr:hypothetical protein H8356DRAFT_1416775 [Neocallimastix sp. JGI-2020a]
MSNVFIKDINELRHLVNESIVKNITFEMCNKKLMKIIQHKNNLVEHGTYINKEDNYGNTPIFYACYNKNKILEKTSLFEACSRRNEILVKYLIEQGEDINSHSNS